MKWPGCLCIFCLLMTGAQAQVSEQSDNLFLLVLDVQPAYYTDQEAADIMVRTINILAESTPASNMAVTQAAGQTLNFSLKGVSKATLPPAELDPKLQLAQASVYTKITPNALEQEELNQQLKVLNAKAVVLCGLMAEQCVYHTAIGALKEGYCVYLIEDAVMGSTPKKKEKALKKLSKKGVVIY